MRRMAIIGGALALGLLAASCGGGNGGGGNGSGGDDDGGGGGESLSVTATEFAFDPSSLTAAAGEVTVELLNEGAVEHDFTIDEPSAHVAAAPGQNASGSVELEAGSYTFYCSVPGHRESGMEGTLTVG